MLSVGIGGDDDNTEELEDIDTDDDLDRNDFSDNLYFPRSTEPGEKDLVLCFVKLVSAGIT